MSSPRETPYDIVEYAGKPYIPTHPDRLYTIGRLYGLEPADPRRARVLELGCSDGGNLLSMAVMLPESSFLGIDAASSAIDSGQKLAAEVGVTNLELKWADLLELDDQLGSFDYIVSHGVYSWVPEPVRNKLLAIVKASLAPKGIAYVSYNAYPGYFQRQMAREIMRHHVRDIDDPEQKIEQALNHLSKIAGTMQQGPYRAALEHELKQLAQAGTSFVYHDALSPENTAFHFEQFMARAAECRLQYLSEAQFYESYEAAALIGQTQALPEVAPPDIVRSEQYLDNFKGRTFRKTLLVHDGLRVDRSLGPARVADMFIWARFQRASSDETAADSQEEQFVANTGARVTTNSPIAKAALAIFSETWPATITFAELLERTLARVDLQGSKADAASELGALIIRCYASRMLELRSVPPVFSLEVAERPLASPLARRQAAIGAPIIVNLRHAMTQLEPLHRALLCALDGTRTRTELLAALAGYASETGVPAPNETDLERMLKELADHALLLAR